MPLPKKKILSQEKNPVTRTKFPSQVQNSSNKNRFPVQIVDILPFERYDALKKSVAQLMEMIEHKDHSKCVERYKKSKDFVGEFPESDKVNVHCKRPSYHADLSDL